jgi:D-inositol-3-phosphate glycosyltransferase
MILKILVISNMYPSTRKPFYGTFVKEQVRCLGSLGHNIRIIGDKGEGNSVLQIGKKYFSLMLRSLAATFISKPDIIHAHFIFPPGFIGWICSMLSGCPLIITSHRADIFDMPYLNKLIFELTRFCLRKANRIVAVSSEIKTKMISDFQIDSKKISVLDMGVRIPNTEESRYPRKLTGERKKLKVIFVGISFRRKGGYVLIRAAEEVQQRFPGRVFYEFIGEKPPEIDRIIERKGLREQVAFIGFLSHTQTLERLKNADIFVLPSSSEGLPIAMLEAMSYGVGVIITPVGGVPFVIKNKENGLLVPVEDHHALAESILALANDPVLLQRIGRQAKKTAQNYSSFQKAIELDVIYRDCLQK